MFTSIVRQRIASRCRVLPTGIISRTTTNSFSTDSGVVVVSIEDALSKTKQALRKIGWDDDDASLQAEIMVSAEICGNNQGLVKMYQPELMAPSVHASKPIVERSTDTSAVINGNQAPGMLAAVMAADRAVEMLSFSDSDTNNKAISIVSTYNTSTSSGQLAFYVNRMAQRGCIGIALANSPEFVAASAGGEKVFGTNPLAVGVPTIDKENPFVFDMATSAIALFGVLTAKAQNTPLPPNVAYGIDGQYTTDANEALGDGGAIATFGGHKGAGLALCVELLAGALSGSAVLGMCHSKKEAKSWGHLFIAIQPDALVDDFPTKAHSIIQTVKQSGPDIRIAGENSNRIAMERREAGEMPIPTKIWDSILHTVDHGLVK